jgi:alpha-ketoglutarate-dependent taurine dioxygenase
MRVEAEPRPADDGSDEPMTESFGRILRPSPDLRDRRALLAEAPRLRQRLADAGAILLRDFGFDLPGMEELSDRLASRFLPHRATAVGKRERVTETTATVNVGGRAFAWHRELGYAPFPPDVLFFLCERPPRRGGETLLCDGRALHARLSDRARDFARSAVVEYAYRLPRESWPLALGASSEQAADAALARLAARLAPPEALAWTLTGDGVRARYCAPMLVAPRASEPPAFCNQVIFRAHKLALKGGGPIPAWFLREVRRAANASSAALAWQAGDLALIDNARVMHARGEIDDAQRRILVRMGYAQS